MRFLFFVGYTANFLPTARVMFSGSVGAKGMWCGGCWSFFLQTQAQAFFEKSSETDPQTSGLGLSLPVKLIIDAECGLHVLKVTCDRFLSSGVILRFRAFIWKRSVWRMESTATGDALPEALAEFSRGVAGPLVGGDDGLEG